MRLTTLTFQLSILALCTRASLASPGFSVEFIEEHCLRCHDGDRREGQLDLEAVLDDDPTRHPEIWETVLRKLNARQMPPKARSRPPEEDYLRFTGSLESLLDAAYRENVHPGRTDTFRRLTRHEYRNAIRDLLDLDVDVESLLPADAESHGFDNITVGDLSPTLLSRYVSAAEKISRLAVGGPLSLPRGRTARVRPDLTQENHLDGLPLGTRGGTLIAHTFPLDGEYEIRIRLSRDRNEEVEGLRRDDTVELLLDRKLVKAFTVRPPRDRNHSLVDAHLLTRLPVKAGPHRIAVTFPERSGALEETTRQPYRSKFNYHRHPRRNPAIFQVTITGPFESQGPGVTPSRRRLFPCEPTSPEEEEDCARTILEPLMRRAYRGPTRDADVERHLAFFRQGRESGTFESGIELALAAILVSPRFLLRVERDPPDLAPGEAYEVSDLELASRLSFFLWGSLPDEPLLDLAVRDELAKPENLTREVERLLADPRARHLVTHFAAQWLHLKNLDASTPDQRLFPDFDENLRRSMRRETELFIEDVFFDSQRGVLDLLKADSTYLDERLARHYGISHVIGSRFRRVDLGENSLRGGLLRHGSLLTVTSYATRTSPVIRGHWILENLLGASPPPPPPDVPTLEENRVSARLPLRERLAKHREDPACSSCHDQMDPVGFALENFDAVGRWRDLDAGRPVDSSGQLLGSAEFTGVEGLERAILSRPDLFVATLTEKLMTFAIGRGLTPRDAPAIRQIVRAARNENFRFASLVQGIVASPPSA